jgi:hypothetical protein
VENSCACARLASRRGHGARDGGAPTGGGVNLEAVLVLAVTPVVVRAACGGVAQTGGAH